MITLHINMPV